MKKVNVKITDKSIPIKKRKQWEKILARNIDKHVGVWKCWFCRKVAVGKIGEKIRTCPNCGIFVGP